MMKKQFYADQLSFYLITGFLSGVLLLILFYLAVYTILPYTFTFSSFLDLHRSSIWILLVDLLPFAGAYGGYLMHHYLYTMNEEFTLTIENEQSIRKNAIEISRKLAGGHYDVKNPDPDIELFSALEELKETLHRNRKAEEKRKSEDRKRNWTSEGLAMFGELLRLHPEDLEELSYQLISNLVKYLDVNQGGFFLVEEEEKNRYFDMLACYAYDRRKFADKRIEWGEGIIGACGLEKKTTYMTDIPESYIAITSGLGKSVPRHLLLVPLINNDEVEGIIELASFTPISDYKIEFVERVADSIAMTLTNIKNSARTAQLLKETQAQARELSRQEEKMRLNMAELKTTQEKAAAQAETFISFTNSVNHTMIRADYAKNGTLLYANTKFLKKLGYSGNREVEGKHISLFINEKDRNWFNKIWEELSQGGKHFEGYMKHITKQGQDLWTMATYTCVRKEDGSVDKILFLAIDTTEQKKQSLDYEGQISALNRLSLKAEFAPDGKLLQANELFVNTFKFPEREIYSMSVFDFADVKDTENLNETWEVIIRGNPFQGQVRLRTKYDEEKWFRATFTSVNDMYGEVAKVIFLANEITNEKIMESETRKQTDQLKKQEEMHRLQSIELEKKLKETEKKLNHKLRSAVDQITRLEHFLNSTNQMFLSVSNTGKLIYINDNAASFFDTSPEKSTGLPSLSLLDGNSKQYPDFIIELFDPARIISKPADLLNIPDKEGNDHEFKIHFDEAQMDDGIVYNLTCTPTDN